MLAGRCISGEREKGGWSKDTRAFEDVAGRSEVLGTGRMAPLGIWGICGRVVELVMLGRRERMGWVWLIGDVRGVGRCCECACGCC